MWCIADLKKHLRKQKAFAIQIYQTTELLELRFFYSGPICYMHSPSGSFSPAERACNIYCDIVMPDRL